MLPLKIGLIIGSQKLWNEVQGCVSSLPVRVVLEQASIGDLDAFLQRLDNIRPEVLLIDLTKLDYPCEQALKRIKGSPAAPIVVALHETADPEVILEAIRAGANEFLYPPLEAGLRNALDRVSADRSKAQAAARQRGKALAFVSVKGGCGASTIACHVGAELSRSTGQEVLLADLDMDSGVVGFLMKSKSQYTILDAVKNVHRLDQSYWKALVSNGHGTLEVITAPPLAGLRVPPSPEEFRNVLQFVRSCYDWVVADLGRGLGPLSATLVDGFDELYLVTTLDLPALHQAKHIVQWLGDAGFNRNRLRLLLNRSPRRSDFTPGELQKAIGVPVFETLPNDYPELYQAYAEGNLLPPTSELAKALAGLAGKIAGLAVRERPKQRAMMSLFQF